jgi:3-oxoacyl-[acyl-carrier protein] reductase
MNELDFGGKRVLVVGGSSGIGNGIAQAFRAHGARVAVCGTRPSAAEYSAEEGSHLDGLDYSQLDVSNAEAIEKFQPSFERLDVLVLAQGAVIYRRGEFEMAEFDERDGMCDQISRLAAGQQRFAHHRELDCGLSLDQRQSGL